LPSWKTESINKIGVSYFDKLILEFDEPFWDLKADWINILSDERGLWNLNFNYYKTIGAPILGMLNCGATAKKVADWSDEMLLESALSSLKNIYPNYRPPVRYYRTNWSKEEFSR
jgi:lysine-specific histone demethylase 1